MKLGVTSYSEIILPKKSENVHWANKILTKVPSKYLILAQIVIRAAGDIINEMLCAC